MRRGRFRRGALIAAGVGILSAVPAAAQTARVAAEAGPGGAVVGRICLDLDRDGGCSDDEPGIAWGRIRFDDGRTAVADEEGRFHLFEVGSRTVLPDRSAYGAHAVSVDGLGLTRRIELAPRGAAGVDLPVQAGGTQVEPGSVAAGPAATPRAAGARVAWPIGGSAPPGAHVRAGETEVVAGADGRWVLPAEVEEGANVVGVAIGSGAGAVALWAAAIDVARPATGALRIYPAPPALLAVLEVTEGGGGLLVTGRATPGVEVRIDGRRIRAAPDGRFGAWVARGAVAPRVSASFGGAQVSAPLPAREGDVPFRGLVLGEGELQLGGSAGFLASGRLAASTSGRWRGWQVDAGLDLDDRDRAAIDLASPRDALASSLAVDPLRTFVVAGDGGAVDEMNAGRGRLWARVEGEGLRLRVGDARTAVGAPELGRHDRAFLGGRAEVERALGPLRLGAALLGGRSGADAAGLASGEPSQDRLLATGGSLLYLSHRQVVAGSEAVTVEWRDPLTRLPLGSRRLVRGRDYDLDAVGGRILLARPLSMVAPAAAILGGDPFAAAEGWIIVDYLRAAASAGGDERGVAGGELRAAAGPLALAAGAASESRAGPDWELLRGRADVDLGAPLRATVEVAQSRGSLFGAGSGDRATSLDGGFQYAPSAGASVGEARAFHAAAEGAAGPARWRGWWRERPGGYSDGTFQEPSAARERGALAEGALGGVGLKLAWAERRGADPLDPTGASRRDVSRAAGSVTWGLGPVDVSVDALHERATLPAESAQSAAGLRASWRLSRELSLEAGHLQSLSETGDPVSATFTSAGASLRTGEGSLDLRAGWGPELGPRLILGGERGGTDDALYGRLSVDPGRTGSLDGGGSAVGGRQRVGEATLFTEERVVREPLGLASGRRVGGELRPVEGLAVSVSGERGERLQADGSAVSRGAAGVGAAFERGPVRVGARAELRTEGSGDQWLAGGNAEWRPLPRLTLGARTLFSDGEIAGRRAKGEEGWVSAAWRADGLSVLARVGRLRDFREGVTDRDAALAGLSVTARVLRHASVALGLDGARQRIAGASDDRVSGSARAAFEVVGPLDLAVEYARRGSLEGRALGDLQALRGEAGLTAGGVRLALGYTVVGFRGSGIDPEDERDGRVYLRAVAVY